MSRLQGIVSALDHAGILQQGPGRFPEITGITDDSRRVGSGMLFCAVQGSEFDGHRFIPDALERGAAALLVARTVDASVPQVVCADSRRAASVAAAEWHGYPGSAMSMVGVTGTNGKTTTVSLIRNLLNADGSAGSVGTLGAIGGSGLALEGHDSLTTPGSVELQEVLHEMCDGGVSKVVLEASSHALDQGRLETLELTAGVFTNLTHEHLDYHGDLDGYLRAKARLIDFVKDDGVLVMNADDQAWRRLVPRANQRTITYGTTSGDVIAADVTHERTHSHCRFSFDGETVQMKVPLPGSFNVSNALAAAATAWGMGMAPVDVADRMATAAAVPGRMEPLVQEGFSIIRDYAHTPDALERAISALLPVTTGRLIVLFGAGGDRDKAKRPSMGRIAARLADIVVVTSDNPRTEDPDKIIDDIEAGMPDGSHVRIVDRREAVHHAVQLLQADDCLLLAGKGHETYQVIGTDYLPFDERLIVADAMRGRAS